MKVFGSKTLFMLLCGAAIVLLNREAAAQDQSANRRLLNQRTVDRIAARQFSSGSSSRLGKSSSFFDLTDKLSRDLELDSVDAILSTDTTTTNKSQSVNAYVNLTTNNQRVGGYDDDEMEGSTKRIAVWHGTRMLSNYVLDSQLGDTYRATVRFLKECQDAVSIKVGKDKSVAVGSQSGGSSSDSRGKRLFELKLHASPQNLVEPRLMIGDDTVLRHDFVHDETILEYEIDF